MQKGNQTQLVVKITSNTHTWVLEKISLLRRNIGQIKMHLLRVLLVKLQVILIEIYEMGLTLGFLHQLSLLLNYYFLK